MREGSFCAVLLLMVASFVSGWCFAVEGKYCSKTVADDCVGAYLGVDSNKNIVTCMLDGSKRYLCRDANTKYWCCVDYACSGQTVYGVQCSSLGAAGGRCLTPMWD